MAIIVYWRRRSVAIEPKFEAEARFTDMVYQAKVTEQFRCHSPCLTTHHASRFLFESLAALAGRASARLRRRSWLAYLPTSKRMVCW